MSTYDLIVRNARLYPMVDDAGLASESAFAVTNGEITALEPPDDAEAREVLDADGRLVLPGFVDCHTHALYAGDRLDEHVLKLQGASYEEIAKSGGGIQTTVRNVRWASSHELVEQTLPRVNALLREGVTTVEIKSGYGLDLDSELKMLEAIRDLDSRFAGTVVPTFLGAHTVPGGVEKTDYVEALVHTMLPAVADAGLAETVDIFVETIAFDTADMKRIFRRAADLGFRLRAHVDQLSNMGATEIACEFGATSCDHLEYTDEAGVKAMAKSGAVAVLLPGAFYFLRETRKPAVDLFRAEGVPMAVATDLNPGSSPVASLLACMHMACVLFGLTPAEALLAVTRNAAKALGHGDRLGGLAPGMRADFSVWDLPSPEFLVYQMGGVHPDAVYVGGRPA